MTKQAKTAISPRRDEDYPEWYQQVIRAAELAEPAPVRGCMVIKPWGFAMWEHAQKILDGMFKKQGHQNAYFPLFIPMSYFEREAEHVEGFAKECAVVTHSRLEEKEGGGLKPGSPLEEPLVVRPTSELIIGEMFSKWIQSYRDLPLKINQWCNVVRWEMRTRLFLRTTEFLWQEGHTAHQTKDEAEAEARSMLDTYVDFTRNSLALPVIYGRKTDSERFPGAVDTYCIESMMQDRKALQSGTSHFFGQNFSKACNITFLDETGASQHAWTTSWGSTTRLLGAVIMTHSDDDGLVLPPAIAPEHVIIVPVIPKDDLRDKVLNHCEALKREIEGHQYLNQSVRVRLDERDMRGGEKRWYWVKKGAPLIIEVGPRDIDNGTVFLCRRDLGSGARTSVQQSDFVAAVSKELKDMQTRMYEKAKAFRESHTHIIDSKEDFYAFFTPKNASKPEIHGGFAMAHWNGTPEVEEQLQKDLKVTIRCIPMEGEVEPGTCFMTGEPSKQRVVFSKSY